MQVARVQARIDCANRTVDNSLIDISPGNYYKYRSHLCERRKVARYFPYGCTRMNNQGALGRGTLTKARGASNGHVRRTRDIMPGDKNLIPVKRRINVYSDQQTQTRKL